LRRGGPVAVAGLGTVGARLAASLASLSVPLLLVDHGRVEPVNVGIQPYTQSDVGMEKTAALRNLLHASRPGLPVECLTVDVERVGPRTLGRCRLIIAVVDSFRTRVGLAQTATRLGLPYLDLALDGTGRSLLGRVSGHDVISGGACYTCGWDTQTWDEINHEESESGCVALSQAVSSTPFHETVSAPPATLALPGLAEIVAGIGMIQATRVLLGSERERVIDRECRINLSSGQYTESRLTRSSRCRSSHLQWTTLLLDRVPAELSLAALFDLATQHLEGNVMLAVHDEAVALEGACPPCQRSVSTVCLRGSLPPCPSCQGRLIPLVSGLRARFDRADIAPALNRSWSALGLPPGGAVVASNRHGHELVFLFDDGMARECSGDDSGTGTSIAWESQSME
jgi:hypothetical protein